MLGVSSSALADGSKLSKARCLFPFELAFHREYCVKAGERVTLSAAEGECDTRVLHQDNFNDVIGA